MSIFEQHPLLARQPRIRSASIWVGARSASAVHERSGVTRIVQYVQCPAVREFCPNQLAFVRTFLQTAREQQPLAVECLYNRAGRSRAMKRIEKEPEAVLGLLVRIKHWLFTGVVDKANWQRTLQLTP